MAKYIIHLKNCSRAIVMTDDSGIPVRDSVIRITKMLTESKIVEFSTNTDTLVVRPTDVIAVQVTGYSGEDITIKKTSKKDLVNNTTDLGNSGSIDEEVDMILEDDIELIEANVIEADPITPKKRAIVEDASSSRIPDSTLLSSVKKDVEKRKSGLFEPVETKIPDNILKEAKKGDGYIPEL